MPQCNPISFLATFKKWFCALAVILFQVSGAGLNQVLQTRYAYHKPFWITYTYTTFLIPLGISQALKFKFEKEIPFGELLWAFDVEITTLSGYSLFRLWALSVPFTVLWLAANSLFTLALPLTNLASVISLEQASLIFVFFLSICFVKEKITIMKICSVIVCTGGVIFIALSDSANLRGGKDAVVGDLLIIGSTMATALYMVFYSKYVGQVPIFVIFTFLGCIGLTNLVFWWIGIVILNFTQVEVWEPLQAGLAVFIFFAGGILSLLFNTFLNVGIIWSSPLFMRVALILTVPVSFIVDLILGHPFNWLRLVGAIIIVLGSVMFSLDACDAQDPNEEEEAFVTTKGEDNIEIIQAN